MKTCISITGSVKRCVRASKNTERRTEPVELVAMSTAASNWSIRINGNGATNSTSRFLQRCTTANSASFRASRPQPSVAMNSGNVKQPAIGKAYATLSSDSPVVSASEITFQKLEEELLDGCSLQHGEMVGDGIRIHFVETGDPTGKLVILLHGFPNFWFVWRYQFRPLVEARYHVIAPDLRGYNTSFKADNVQGYARSEVLSDLVKLIDHFGGGKPAIMVGHDWGAAISWCLVEDHPTKVERLVTANMGRLIDLYKLRYNYQQLWRSWYIAFFQIPVIPEWILAYDDISFIRNFTRSAPSATDEDIKRHLAAYSIAGAIKGGISYYRAAFRGLWSRQDGTAPVVDIPITVLWGDRDNYLLPILAEPDREQAPNVTVVHLPKSGHWPMWDEPTLFNKLLLEAMHQDKEGYHSTTKEGQ